MLCPHRMDTKPVKHTVNLHRREEKQCDTWGVLSKFNIKLDNSSQKVMILFYWFYFISFAKKKKQTNRKNVGRDTATAVANYSGPGY